MRKGELKVDGESIPCIVICCDLFGGYVDKGPRSN